MRVHCGDRDRRVTIQQMTEDVDESFTPTETWTPLCRVWAEKIEVSGLEKFRAQQLSAPYNTRWRIPYRRDMDPELVNVPKSRRLVWQSRNHDIVSATMISRRDGIELETLSKAS